MTIGRRSALKAEHYPVFDCATSAASSASVSSPGKEPHPHHGRGPAVISGAISKTINMPYDATLGRREEGLLAQLAVEMTKANALYRDGSKLSQPLNSVAVRGGGAAGRGGYASGGAEGRAGADGGADHREDRAPLHRHKRRRLPDRRAGYTQKARIGTHKMYIRHRRIRGRHPRRKSSSTCTRKGPAFRSMTNCFAIAISLGFSTAWPLDEFVDAFLFTGFEPNGVVQATPTSRIEHPASSDYIFRELAITYLAVTTWPT